MGISKHYPKDKGISKNTLEKMTRPNMATKTSLAMKLKLQSKNEKILNKNKEKYCQIK